jgi:hypothetical protein
LHGRVENTRMDDRFDFAQTAMTWFGILHPHMKLRAAEASLLDLFDRELIPMDIEQSQLSAQVFEAKACIDQCLNGHIAANT